jgi:hypothetical protein
MQTYSNAKKQSTKQWCVGCAAASSAAVGAHLEQYEQIEPTRHEDEEQCDQQKRMRL